MEVAYKRKPGRPKVAPEKRMEIFSVQIPHEIRQRLDFLAMNSDKSISQLAREALLLLSFLYDKEKSDDKN